MLTLNSSAQDEDKFIFSITTTVPNELFVIPVGTGSFSYDVDWEGTGTYSTDTGQPLYTTDAGHTYATPNTYIVYVRGTFSSIKFDGTSDHRNKIKNVIQWGHMDWQSFESAFHGCEELDIIATDFPDLSNVTEMRRAFKDCKKLENLNGSFVDWNMSNVTDTYEMFMGAEIFDGNVTNWNTGNVTNMGKMFSNATSFNQPLIWDVSSVQTMISMFNGASVFNQDLNWDVSSVEIMRTVFANTNEFNGNITAWDVSAATTMAGMFNNALKFNQPIINWETGSVWNFNQMFQGAIKFNQNINAVGLDIWDVSSATSMSSMFQTAVDFNGDISNWDVISVENMDGMFNTAGAFNQDIGDWNTSSVLDMTEMFRAAIAFDQDVGDWPIHNVSTMTNMFLGATLSLDNYDALLIGWEAHPPKNNVNFHGGNSKYCLGEAAWINLDAAGGFNWTIIDGGKDCPYQAICQDAIISIDQFGNAELTVDLVNADSNEPGGDIFAMNLDIEDFDCSDIDTSPHVVTLTAIEVEVGSSTCTANITVIDDIAPSLNCFDVPTTIELNALGVFDLDVDPMITTADNCGTPNLSVAPASFDCSNLGPQVVTLTSTDAYNNFSTCSVNVVVEDNHAPAAFCQDIIVELDEDGTASITPEEVNDGSKDNCTMNFDLSQTDFTCADLTTNPSATLTVTDDSNNQSTCISQVTILDIISAEVFCIPNVITSLDINGEAHISTVDVDDGSTDNCDFDLILSQNVFTAAHAGDNPVEMTLTDSNGDELTCNTIVTVLDPNLPVCSTILTPMDGAVEVPIDSPLTWDITGTEDGALVNIGLTPGGSEVAQNIDVGLVDNYIPTAWNHSTTYYYTISPYNQFGVNIACPTLEFYTYEATAEDIYVPKFFTPNGDGFNDVWNINYKGFIRSIQIYNRFGKFLATMDPDKEGWDGTYDGRLMPDDDYWFEATFTDRTVLRGHFSLITR